MNINQLVKILQEAAEEPIELTISDNTNPSGLIVATGQLIRVCEILHHHPELYFDYLSCITAIDQGLEENIIALVYQLYSIPHNQQVMLKVLIPRNNENGDLPTVPTISTIWEAANWHEREAYDLMGIAFEGHPDLRRILLPADWSGHPLRTDDKPPTSYHGIIVD